MEAGLIDDYIRNILSIPFCPRTVYAPSSLNTSSTVEDY